VAEVELEFACSREPFDFNRFQRSLSDVSARPSQVRYPPHVAQSKLPEDLEQRLLALAPADRLALATRLLASVEGPDPDRDEAWSEESGSAVTKAPQSKGSRGGSDSILPPFINVPHAAAMSVAIASRLVCVTFSMCWRVS
jgi:hypothetical protein